MQVPSLSTKLSKECGPEELGSAEYVKARVAMPVEIQVLST